MLNSPLQPLTRFLFKVRLEVLAWLLMAMFLIVQFAALAHGVEHGLEPAQDDAPICELCLAYNPLGNGIVGSQPTWPELLFAADFNAPLPVASPCCFRPLYQSRAPPLTC